MPSPRPGTTTVMLPLPAPVRRRSRLRRGSSPQPRRSCSTRSATARSCPDGDGVSTSRRNSSRRSSRVMRRLTRATPRARRRAGAQARGGADELAEQRRRPCGAALELGVELRGDEAGVVGQLDDLDQPAVGRRAADDEPGRLELRPQVVVDLEAVAVTLEDHLLAVRRRRPWCRPPGAPRWRPGAWCRPCPRRSSARAAGRSPGRASPRRTPTSWRLQPQTLRANSITAHCMPRQTPR